jgi:hypothetical protein
MRASAFERDETGANREPRQTGDIVDIESLHEEAAVSLDRLAAEIQTVSNLLGGLPFGDQLENFTLTRAQQLKRTGYV